MEPIQDQKDQQLSLKIIDPESKEVLFQYPLENVDAFYQKIKELESLSLNFETKVPTLFESLFHSVPESLRSETALEDYYQTLEEEINEHICQKPGCLDQS